MAWTGMTLWASQLGPDRAIVKYFAASGWKPGMSELDAYSVVNAAHPAIQRVRHRQEGAPGTVQDKVNNQFGLHRDKAYALRRRIPPSTASGSPHRSAECARRGRLAFRATHAERP